ncbi:DUF6090 family protein [Aegicerativicinus sediminis]
MIKLFNRIREKSVSKGQFGKYLVYAIGEIFLVVIGILIALQVNNWNENQKEFQRSIKLLQNLKEELFQDSMYFNNVYTAEKDLFLQASEELFRIHNPDYILQPGDSTVKLAFRYACFTPVIKYSDNAYNELMSSDLINQISSEGLKHNLHEYYGQVKFLNSYSEQSFQLSNSLIMELAEYYEVIPGKNPNSRSISEFSGAAEDEFSTIYDLESFRENRSLNPKLYDMIDIHKDRLGGLEIVKKLARLIQTDIDKELSTD